MTNGTLNIPEPPRCALPEGWEWRMYGARHTVTGRCACWSPQAGRWVVDDVVGDGFEDLLVAIEASGFEPRYNPIPGDELLWHLSSGSYYTHTFLRFDGEKLVIRTTSPSGRINTIQHVPNTWWQSTEDGLRVWRRPKGDTT